MKVLAFKTPCGNEPIHKFLKDLLKNHKEVVYYKLISALKGLEEYGLNYNEVSKNAIKYLRDGIYELRALSSRVFFFCVKGDTIILLHGFEKKELEDMEPEKLWKEIRTFVEKQE